MGTGKLLLHDGPRVGVTVRLEDSRSDLNLPFDPSFEFNDSTWITLPVLVSTPPLQLSRIAIAFSFSFRSWRT